jgi:hypothetical protein
MSDDALARMHRRARAVATRAAVRRWQYRQRHHAAGVWLRLRRVLAAAETVYAIPPGEASALVAEGYVPERCGLEIAPAKTIVFVDRRRADAIAGRQTIPARLGPEFLAAPALALVRFGAEGGG